MVMLNTLILMVSRLTGTLGLILNPVFDKTGLAKANFASTLVAAKLSLRSNLKLVCPVDPRTKPEPDSLLIV